MWIILDNTYKLNDNEYINFYKSCGDKNINKILHNKTFVDSGIISLINGFFCGFFLNDGYHDKKIFQEEYGKLNLKIKIYRFLIILIFLLCIFAIFVFIPYKYVLLMFIFKFMIPVFLFGVFYVYFV